jgi:hypothetical protein
MTCPNCLVLETQVAVLREALERFGAHHDLCRLVTTGPKQHPCDCGLRAALSSGRSPDLHARVVEALRESKRFHNGVSPAKYIDEALELLGETP